MQSSKVIVLVTAGKPLAITGTFTATLAVEVTTETDGKAKTVPVAKFSIPDCTDVSHEHCRERLAQLAKTGDEPLKVWRSPILRTTKTSGVTLKVSAKPPSTPSAILAYLDALDGVETAPAAPTDETAPAKTETASV